MINKSQFFEQLAGKTSVVKTSIGEIEIRSLSFADVQEIQAQELDGMEASLQFIVRGLVSPKLELEDVENLRQANPTKLFEIAKAIQEISGLVGEEDFLKDTGETS